MKVHIDYETRSELDVRKVGAELYGRHPSTEILCLGFKIENEPTGLWRPGDRWPKDLDDCIRNPRFLIAAHNAGFEQSITNWVLRRTQKHLPHFSPCRFDCTAARAAAAGLPRKLEMAAEALTLSVRKDMEGHRVMLKCTKPRSKWVKTGEGPKWFDDPKDLQRVYDYCINDVEVEAAIDRTIPALHPTERLYWEMDQFINQRGIQVDIPLVKQILKFIAAHTSKLKKELSDITDGAIDSPAQVLAITAYLKGLGAQVSDLTAGTVEKALKGDLDPKARRILEIRKEASKSSTAKYKTFLTRTDDKGIARDILLFNGAIPTARWAGTGIQLQNLPRGERVIVDNIDHALAVIRKGDFELLSLIFNSPMEVFSTAIRSMLVPRLDYSLYCGDKAQIEVRVLFWLARHDKGLALFEKGGRIYEYQAAEIFQKPESEVNKEERQLGKATILGGGFGMGPKKFQITCAGKPYYLTISEERAKRAIQSYRETHRPVVTLWSNYEKAAILAVQNRGKIYKVNRVAWHYDGRWLWCTLPSGRRLPYFEPKISVKNAPWGEPRPLLSYKGMNSKTKKFEYESTYGGKLAENVTQAVARDLMAAAMKRTRDKGFDVLLSVHDENIAEAKDGYKTLEEFQDLMETTPDWAQGIPMKVDCWTGKRYKK